MVNKWLTRQNTNLTWAFWFKSSAPDSKCIPSDKNYSKDQIDSTAEREIVLHIAYLDSIPRSHMVMPEHPQICPPKVIVTHFKTLSIYQRFVESHNEILIFWLHPAVFKDHMCKVSAWSRFNSWQAIWSWAPRSVWPIKEKKIIELCQTKRTTKQKVLNSTHFT